MRKGISFIMALCCFFCLCGCGAKPVTPTPDEKDLSFRLSVDRGWVIHKPTAAQGNVNGVYRYGPCLITDDVGGLHMYTASPGNVYAEWDWGRYRFSPDGGKTWEDEGVAVKPTPGQMDSVSTCDPGVIKIGDYYYAGYTSTYNPGGVSNNIFIARSKTPAGPFVEKWTGSGWSEYASEPILPYDGNPGTFGVGEPAFVVKDNTLYIYYNWWDNSDWDGRSAESGMTYTKVATVDLSENKELWPSRIVDRGVAFSKQKEGEDSSDVKYVEEYDMFLGINTAQRFEPESHIQVYESKDGITFRPASVIKADIAKRCHNMGISGDAQGHIKKGDPIYLAYAYSTNPDSPNWANWYTRMHNVTIDAVEFGSADEQEKKSNKQYLDFDKDTHSGSYIETIHSASPVLHLLVGKSLDLRIDKMTGSLMNTLAKAEDLSFALENEGIVSINGLKVTADKAGETYIKVTSTQNSKATTLLKVFAYDSPFRKAIASTGVEFVENLLDGEKHGTAKISTSNKDRWLGVEALEPAEVGGLTIYPKFQDLNMPSKFKVQYRSNGVWADVPNQTHDFKNRGSSSVMAYVMKFDQDITADALRVVDLVNGGDSFEIAEMVVLLSDMANAEISPMESEYKLYLNGKDDADTINKKIYAQIKLRAFWAFGCQDEYYNNSKILQYSGYDNSIIEVDDNGKITAKGQGETTVTINFYGKTTTCKVTVKNNFSK